MVQIIRKQLTNKSGYYFMCCCGMGCYLYVRNNGKFIEYIFLSESDGDEVCIEKSVNLQRFINGYKKK